MALPTGGAPVAHPGTTTLDDLDLLRGKILPPSLVTIPRGPVRLVDAEGAPVADVSAAGEITWTGRRSGRPFERWHLPPSACPAPVVLVDDPSGLTDLPPGTGTLLVAASTDGEDERDVALVGQALRAARRYAVQLAVVPLGHAADRWAEKKDHVVAAWGGPDQVVDRTVGLGGASPAGQGLVVLLTGLSGSGKSTLARAVRNELLERSGAPVTLLDGDVVRRHLSAGLTFSAEDRDRNVRRIGWVAAEIARHGGRVLCSPIAPFEATRRDVRRMVESRGGRFLLVHVATPLAECERRDRKGLYARARAGEVPDFTGVSSPYEEPTDADLVLDTTGRPVEQLRDVVVDELLARGWVDLDPPAADGPADATTPPDAEEHL